MSDREVAWQCKESDDDELSEGDEEALGVCERSSSRYNG